MKSGWSRVRVAVLCAALAGASVVVGGVAEASPWRAASGEAGRVPVAATVIVATAGDRSVATVRPSGPADPGGYRWVALPPGSGEPARVAGAVLDRWEGMVSPRFVAYRQLDPCAGETPPPRDLFRIDPERAKAAAAAAEGSGVPTALTTERALLVFSTAGDLASWKGAAKSGPEVDAWIRARLGEGWRVVGVPASSDGTVAGVRVGLPDGPVELPWLRGEAAERGDTLVIALASGTRMRVAGVPERFAPTNALVAPGSSSRMPSVFGEVFARMLSSNPSSPVTLFAGSPSTCDPCPPSLLQEEDYSAIGLGELPGGTTLAGELVATALLVRDAPGATGLTLEAGPPMEGGTEVPGPDGRLLSGVREGRSNAYQVRFTSRAAWSETVACEAPATERWGAEDGRRFPIAQVSPPGSWARADDVSRVLAEPIAEVGLEPVAGAGAMPRPRVRALENVAAMLPRGGAAIAAAVTAGADASAPEAPSAAPEGARTEAGGPAVPPPPSEGCASCSAAGGAPSFGALAVIGALLVWRRRRSGRAAG